MLRSPGAAVNPHPRASAPGRFRALSDQRAFEPGDLSAWLRTSWLGRSSTYHESIDSTQDEALRLAAGDAPHGFLVWAGTQTAGRGRLRRAWQSPALSGLWFSVVLRPGVSASTVAALPLAMGVAVGTALADQAPGRVRLKWPNDVLLEGRKVAGILIDAHTHAGSVDHAVVGVGVNLRRPPGGFPAEIAATAAALEDLGTPPASAVRLLAGLLDAMEREYEALLAGGPSGARERWLAMADTIGREVVASLGGEKVAGTALDLDTDGNLVVETADGRVTIAYGEIEHLR